MSSNNFVDWRCAFERVANLRFANYAWPQDAIWEIAGATLIAQA